MTIDAFHGFTLAIVLLFVGKGLVARWGILRRYSIPESLVGGLACALVVFVLYYGAGIVVSFDLEARDALLLYFFAAIGLGTDARTLRLIAEAARTGDGVGWHEHDQMLFCGCERFFRQNAAGDQRLDVHAREHRGEQPGEAALARVGPRASSISPESATMRPA